MCRSNTINWRDTTHFASEDDYRTGCWNVSHCQQQQSHLGLRSLGRSNSTYFWNDSWVQTFHSFKLYLVVLVSPVLRRRQGKTGLPYAARRKSSKNYLHSTPIAPKLRLSIDTVNNGPFEDQVHPDDHAQPTHEMTPGFKPYTVLVTYEIIILCLCWNRN